jgi:hypothetical protein
MADILATLQVSAPHAAVQLCPAVDATQVSPEIDSEKSNNRERVLMVLESSSCN